MGGEVWRVTWMRLQRRSLGTGLWEGFSAGVPRLRGGVEEAVRVPPAAGPRTGCTKGAQALLTQGGAESPL